MKLNKVSANNTIKQVQDLLDAEKEMSSALKLAIKLLIDLFQILLGNINKNSRNSSKPPSTDNNKSKGKKGNAGNKKPGGQNGHAGSGLKQVDNPDKIELINVNKTKLPKGKYTEVGYESRQVFDINITRIITEYRAQILENQNGKIFKAEFPKNVKNEVQYGNEVKVSSVYSSQFQLIPYQRIQDQFADQMNLSLSTGTIFNFNKEAYDLLIKFDDIAKKQLITMKILHADETGINVNKKRIWLHLASSDTWTYYYPHEKRGGEAIDEIGILPNFKGTLCHDHWKPYYKYNCTHSLCNAHHLRELTFAEEQDNQAWAKKMRELLLEMNTAVNNSGGGYLDKDASNKYRENYREILLAGDKECPSPIRKEGQKGKLKKTKSRNLLERLRSYENDTLRFMEDKSVPFTNNLGENDLRMTKVQQKISGCFRSIEGAKIFCRVRSYISTCRKNSVEATEALRLLFNGKMPDFIAEIIKKE